MVANQPFLARLRAAWRALWNTTTAIVAVDPTPERRINPNVMWEANRHGSPAVGPEITFSRVQPMAGVLPQGMALDALPQMDAVSNYAVAQMHHEGLGFLGYPYLAELSQRAEYRKIATIWAEHCTRKWIKLRGNDGRVKELDQALDRHEVRAKFQAAIERECFFGRMQMFLDFGDNDQAPELRTPLAIDPGKINENRPLKNITLVEPMWSYPGPYDANNPLSPGFYVPPAWFVSGRTVHSSRLLTLIGHAVPTMLKPAYAFGGVALTQMCKPYVDNWLRTRQSVSDLVHSFSVMVLKTEMDQVLAGGEGDSLFTRAALFTQMRDNRGVFVIDKNAEDFANVSAPIAGLPELQSQAQEQMASVAGIPLVVLLGITPSGLNASSDGEIRVFYDAVHAYLERVVEKPLRTIIDVLQLSLWGKIDEEISFEFLPLWEMSDSDKAAIRKSDAEADVGYINAGVIDPEESRERLRNDETSLYHGVDLSGDAPELPDGELDDPGAVKLPKVPGTAKAANDKAA